MSTTLRAPAMGLAETRQPLPALTHILVDLASKGFPKMPERYLFDAQQRKEIHDRAKWSFIDHRRDVAAPGASCGPVTNFLIGERAPCPSGAIWEECYDIPGSPYYLRLAYEVHRLPPGACPDKVPGDPVEHFNITIGMKGAWPNDFNCNRRGRTIPFDAHAVVWVDRSGRVCFNFSFTWRGPNGNERHPHKCLFSSCGKPPSPPFLPWARERAVEYFHEVFAWIKSWLESVGVVVQIAEGVILLIGAIIIITIAAAALIAAAAALTATLLALAL
jgi:hypothetical protein